MFILQFAMFDWFANNITHRIFISPAEGACRNSLHSLRPTLFATAYSVRYGLRWSANLEGYVSPSLNRLCTKSFAGNGLGLLFLRRRCDGTPLALCG
ncbi:hypothetical protein LF1_24240 [Rubripirellula obstinata]|uniref:Uncharacterized protein n=1 Tax=Rubripirellula obstinata TaxID=406547 RepID=A0A5B1CFB2_9BACT|nr:hypothetical protein LF1_24240 [Rubripirellula obstinata]